MKTDHPPSGLLRGLDLLIDADWTPEQARAVIELLDDLRERIGEALRSAILVKPAVELHEPGSLPVSEGKAKRVVDLRPAF